MRKVWKTVFEYIEYIIVWKVSKYAVFSGPYFPYSVWISENTDQKKLRI